MGEFYGERGKSKEGTGKKSFLVKEGSATKGLIFFILKKQKMLGFGLVLIIPMF